MYWGKRKHTGKKTEHIMDPVCDRNNSRASKISWPNWRPSIRIQEEEIMSSSTPEIP